MLRGRLALAGGRALPAPALTAAMLTAMLTAASTVAVATPAPPAAGAGLGIDCMLGGAVNAPASLAVRQKGEPEIEFTADYDTRPLEFPLYYALRASVRDSHGAWEFQLLHHKLHLSNTTDEVERFEITHGFNVLTVGRAFGSGSTAVRAGAGIVLAHPDSRVRGVNAIAEGLFGTGYEVAGPAAMVGAGRRFGLGGAWTAVCEVQVTAAHARVSLAHGEARTTNVAFHAMLGVGYLWNGQSGD